MRADDFWVMCGVTQNKLMVSILAEKRYADLEIFFGCSAESLLAHLSISSLASAIRQPM